MNLKLVARLVGGMLVPLILCAAACLGFAVWESSRGVGEPSVVLGFSLCLGVFACASLGLFLLGRGIRSADILRRDVVGIVALGWLIASVFGSLPFLLCGDARTTVAKAFFESVSGYTTTGSTIFDNLESLPRPILLWRAISQWLGGLGIVVLFAALLPSLGFGGKSLMSSESSMDLERAPTSRIGDLAKRCWVLYTALTLLCFCSLWSVGRFTSVDLGVFEATLYAMTTVATGGFAPHDASVGHFDSLAVELIIVFFMLLGSISMLLLIHVAWREKTRLRTGRTEGKIFLGVVLVAWLLISLNLTLSNFSVPSSADTNGWASNLRSAFFPVVAMASSCGFGTTDYDQWPLFSRCLIGFLMVVGGCTGSTAGGLKVMRAAVLFQILREQVLKTYRPNLVKLTRLDGVTLSAEVGYRVALYFAACFWVVALSTAVIAFLEPQIGELDTALGAVFATFFNMGPGFGAVGPSSNFAEFSSPAILFLSLLMLLGRLEIFVLVAIFTRSFWRRF